MSSHSPEFQKLLSELKCIAESENREWQTLPPAAFHSRELFDLEKEQIFRSNWICIGRADQVANAGDYMAVDIIGEPILMVRGTDMEIRVMSNVCRHRWMKVCHGSGNCKSLVCPYHSWSYDLDGKLLFAVEMEDCPGFGKGEKALPIIRHETWQGFVYVNLDGQARPLSEQLAHIDSEIEEFDLQTWEVVASTDLGEYPWDWKVMQDNGECFHHVGAHLKTFEPHFPARMVQTRCHESTIMQWSPSRDSSRTKGEDGMDYVPHYFTPKSGLTEIQRTSFLLIYLLPNFFIYLQPDYGINYRVYPVAPGKIHAVADHFVPPHTKDDDDFQSKLKQAVEFFILFNEEDVVINSAIQKGLQSHWAERGTFSHLEAHNQHVARWISEKLTKC